MLAGVRLEVMVPSAEEPADGQLVVSVEMTPLSSPDYRPGRQPGVVAVIAQRLQDVLLGCGVLRPRELCIAEGQAVWVAYLDVHVLNAAGSLLDAALLAALGALRDTRLPCVHVTDEGNVERDGADAAADGQSAGGRTVPLRLHGCPLSLTCGVYKGQLIADPDHEEEGLMSASISVVVDEGQQLLGELAAAGLSCVACEGAGALVGALVAARRTSSWCASTCMSCGLQGCRLCACVSVLWLDACALACACASHLHACLCASH